MLELCLGLRAARAQGADISSGKRVALLIGNAIYLDGYKPVPTALHDARNLGTELRRNNFDVDLMENLTRADMLRILDFFSPNPEPGWSSFLYFSVLGQKIGNKIFLSRVDAHI